MKSKLLITSLSLIAASAYAQPSMPAGASPSANRPEVSRAVVPSSPQVGAKPLSGPALNAAVPVIESRIVPFTANGATNSVSAGASGSVSGVSASGGDGSRGGNITTPKPPSTMYSGVGPLPANDAKAPTNDGQTVYLGLGQQLRFALETGAGESKPIDAQAPTSVGATEREYVLFMGADEILEQKIINVVD